MTVVLAIMVISCGYAQTTHTNAADDGNTACNHALFSTPLLSIRGRTFVQGSLLFSILAFAVFMSMRVFGADRQGGAIPNIFFSLQNKARSACTVYNQIQEAFRRGILNTKVYQPFFIAG